MSASQRREEILTLLKKNRGKTLSASLIASHFHVSRAQAARILFQPPAATCFRAGEKGLSGSLPAAMMKRGLWKNFT